jgi:hypothetical protein
MLYFFTAPPHSDLRREIWVVARPPIKYKSWGLLGTPASLCCTDMWEAWPGHHFLQQIFEKSMRNPHITNKPNVALAAKQQGQVR